MESVRETIEKYNLIKEGDVVGVGVSGGQDSMALLHYLIEYRKEKKFEIVVVNIDHSIREESEEDSRFVMNYAKEHKLRAHTFKIDVPKYSEEEGLSLETAARDVRYRVFASLIEKNIVNKIATAHHLSDQAETILFHIFRGCGTSGAKGMEIKRDYFIRPMLETKKKDIVKYVEEHDIHYVEDKTNKDNSYDRNYIRNVVIPSIEKRWPAFTENLSNFATCCKEDDEYINSKIITDNIIVEKKTVRIPLSSFIFEKPVIARIIFKALAQIGVNKDIENKHINLIIDLAKKGQNGAKIKLANNVSCYKEYDFVTLSNQKKEMKVGSWPFKIGKYDIDDFGRLQVKSVDKMEYDENLYVDANKIPKTAKWRYRKDGDTITKFGGGTKKLKTYLIDKKVPARKRDDLVVLADKNEIYVVAGVGISDKAKIDDNTKKIYQISVK